MKATLTRKGRTVVPAKIRKRYNLHTGDRLIWIDDGRVVKVIFTNTDIVSELRDSGKGHKLTERLLAKRHAKSKYAKI